MASSSSRLSREDVLALLDAEEEDDAVDEPFFPGSDDEVGILEEEDENEDESQDDGEETGTTSDDEEEVRCVFISLCHMTINTPPKAEYCIYAHLTALPTSSGPQPVFRSRHSHLQAKLDHASLSQAM